MSDSKIKKVHKVEGADFRKLEALYDKSYEAAKQSAELKTKANRLRDELWELIPEVIGTNNSRLHINSDYKHLGYFLIEERGEERSENSNDNKSAADSFAGLISQVAESITKMGFIGVDATDKVILFEGRKYNHTDELPDEVPDEIKEAVQAQLDNLTKSARAKTH